MLAVLPSISSIFIILTIISLSKAHLLIKCLACLSVLYHCIGANFDRFLFGFVKMLATKSQLKDKNDNSPSHCQQLLRIIRKFSG